MSKNSNQLSLEISVPDAAKADTKSLMERFNEDLSNIQKQYDNLKVRELEERPSGVKGEAELIRILIENSDSIKDWAAIVYYLARSVSVLYQTYFGNRPKKRKKEDDQKDLIEEINKTNTPKIEISVDGKKYAVPLSDEEIEELKNKVKN